jgi:hypothetical protein
MKLHWLIFRFKHILPLLCEYEILAKNYQQPMPIKYEKLKVIRDSRGVVFEPVD